MKAFFALVVVALVAVANAALTEDQEKTVKKFRDECVAEVGIDIAVIEKAKKGEYTETEKLGQFLKCFGTKLQFINADGSYNTQRIKEKLSQKFDKDLSSLVDKCVADDKKDAAKNAVHLAKCIRENMENYKGIY